MAQILVLLLRLRQLCIHPALLIDGEAHFSRTGPRTLLTVSFQFF